MDLDKVLNRWVFLLLENEPGIGVQMHTLINEIRLHPKRQLNPIDHITVKDLILFLQLKELISEIVLFGIGGPCKVRRGEELIRLEEEDVVIGSDGGLGFEEGRGVGEDAFLFLVAEL